MSEIMRRRESELPVTWDVWSPARLLREITRWDPLREPMAMWDDGFAPKFDVKETKEAYIFKADMPGVRPGDINVALAGNRLTVAGKRDAEEKREGEAYYAVERASGAFTRTFTLPEGTDAEKVHAELQNGVLTLYLTKKAEVKTRQIPVKAGT